MLVHIIDDDKPLGRTVARSARQAGWESFFYDSADEFLEQMDNLPFGCIITDINMPRMSGLELIETLHTKYQEWPVIMMTGYGDVAASISSFRAGAIHFLQKPFKRTELLAALAEAAQIGQQRKLVTNLQQYTTVLRKLTKRETEVLKALADGTPSKTIAWEFDISVRTVEMHRSNILAKLGARNTVQAVAMFQTDACLPISYGSPATSVTAP